MKKILNPFRLLLLLVFTLWWILASSFILHYTPKVETDPNINQQTAPPAKSNKIQIALLLDTSNSMDGLIEQAKSQLWNIVNELSKAKCEGETPVLEIALYEYGNDRLNAREGFIRQVAPLISDLDQISTKLFELRTNGGQEYCGYVIDKASKQLEWSGDDNAVKLIFIAGNQPFSQGNVSYESACGDARQKGITINTIFCGNYNEGVRTNWKSGALIGGGDYMSIQQDRRTVYVQTPYDEQINTLNIEFNNTYHYYGQQGKMKKMEQVQADSMASKYSQSNLATRNSIKVSKYYQNSHWDLVDASKDKNFDINKVDKNTLPPKLQKMNNEELTAFIDQENQRREKIKTDIAQLKVKREAYIKENQVETEANVESGMIKAIKKQAKAKNYSW